MISVEKIHKKVFQMGQKKIACVKKHSRDKVSKGVKQSRSVTPFMSITIYTMATWQRFPQLMQCQQQERKKIE